VATDRPEFELSAPGATGSVGEQLKNARLAQGMTIDAVAKQLKLAPRQVTALETDDVASLPGGPFVRGFVRNYARLVRIDPDTLVHADETRRNAAPPLQGMTPAKGELRDGSAAHSAPSLRWLIPLILVGAVGAAAYLYESRKGRIIGGSSSIPAAQISTPNPNASPTNGSTDSATKLPETTANNVTAPGLPPVIVAPVPSTPVIESAAAAPTSAANAPGADGKLVSLELAFAAPSWTEIRDASGNVLTSKLQPVGSTVSVSGKPPFRLTVGEASNVSLSRNGVKIDLAAKAGSGNVAKFTLE
jgi:cytoskeleton protein RodZ